MGVDADDPGRFDGGSFDDLVQRETQAQKLGEGGGKVVDGIVDGQGMDVGADGVGQKSLGHCTARNAEGKASHAVAHVEEDPALPGIPHHGTDLPFPIQDRRGLGAVATMSHHVAGSKGWKQVLQRHVRPADVNHDRLAAFFRRFQGCLQDVSEIHGSGHTLIETDLDPQSRLRVAKDAFGALAGIQVVVMDQFAPARGKAHAGEVHVTEDASLGGLDHVSLQTLVVDPAGRSGVHDGGDSGARTEIVRLDPQEGDSFVDVRVQIDEAGHHQETGGVQHLGGILDRKVAGHGRYPARLDGHVQESAPAVGRVDDRPTLQQQIVVSRGACHSDSSSSLRTSPILRSRISTI